jgi:hypothetical protein
MQPVSDSATLYLVREVHNFGGFFGGDTVTLTAVVHGDASGEEHTLTIDERALANVRDRHTIAAGMLVSLKLAGERVDRAELLAAATRAELRAALGAPTIDGPLEAPRILSYRCAECDLWVAGAPEDGRCRLCGQAI